ncbi:hypothetical protein [Mycolicibacterium sp. P9-22]|uniref:hypothetical protein n=1 Tax=Mycolicibacterium sp. P9-22 TaxID=2024613 RepID=UPI0011ECDE4F|nr:hypothetical protein [Mycolicibacterium sp. P9-22]KAA0115771.1 hypothetical protein CIW51_14325 [Mycolicibacterium sp. P9-22]
MITVPAFVWRGGFVSRALITGGAVGAVLGALAWLDSGFPPAGACVFVIVAVCYGGWMSRRMSRHWPGAAALNGPDRVAVARAVRSGERLDDPRLAAAVVGYSRGIASAAQHRPPLRWLLVCVLVVAVLTAVWDAVFGSVGNAVASAVYLAMLVAEIWWWPPRRAQLLANAERVCGTPDGTV